jgi:alkyl hydroperoxide reductase subunit AhpF
MPLLADEDVRYLQENFAALARDVSLTVVTREKSRLVVPGAEPDDGGAPDATEEVKQIASELAATSPRLKLSHVDAAADAERAHELAGERLPAIVFSSETSRGKLRYYGLPAGYEMSTMVTAVLDLGGAEPPLPPELGERLGRIARDVHIQVFVTPS